jgi:hypothetical protein
LNWDHREHAGHAPQTCRAKAKISVQTKDENFSAHSQIKFDWKKKESELLIRFLNPFRSPVGDLKVTPHEKSWTDGEGKMDLSPHPAFQKWFSLTWINEFAFMFGQFPAGANIRMSDDETVYEMRAGTRNVECHFETPSAEFPKSCHIRDAEMNGQIDFAFADCRSTL